MDWLTIERGIWSVAIGAFLSFLVATLAVPFGSLAWIVVFCVSLPVGAVVVYRAGFAGGIGPRPDEPGRLTLLLVVGFAVALVGYTTTSELTGNGSLPELLGQLLSLGVAWWLANWLVYRGGVERLRGRVVG